MAKLARSIFTNPHPRQIALSSIYRSALHREGKLLPRINPGYRNDVGKSMKWRNIVSGPESTIPETYCRLEWRGPLSSRERKAGLVCQLHLLMATRTMDRSCSRFLIVLGLFGGYCSDKTVVDGHNAWIPRCSGCGLALWMSTHHLLGWVEVTSFSLRISRFVYNFIILFTAFSRCIYVNS